MTGLLLHHRRLRKRLWDRRRLDQRGGCSAGCGIVAHPAILTCRCYVWVLDVGGSAGWGRVVAYLRNIQGKDVQYITILYVFRSHCALNCSYTIYSNPVH